MYLNFCTIFLIVYIYLCTINRRKDLDTPQSAANRLLAELEQELKTQEQNAWELEEELRHNRERHGELQSSLKAMEEEYKNLNAKHQKTMDECNQKKTELQYAQE